MHVRLRAWPAALLAVACGVAPCAASAESGPDDSLQPPRLAQWFRMDAWQATRSASGDLDQDGHVDIAVILERTAEPGGRIDPPRSKRLLVILQSDADGQWRRGPALRELLPCGRCGDVHSGVVESMVFDLTVTDDNVLEIGWLQQRDTLAGVWLRIGWDEQAGELALLGDQITTAGRSYDEHTRLERDYQAGVERRDGGEQAIEPRLIPATEVNASDYGP